MKQFIAIVLSLIFCLSFAACGSESAPAASQSAVPAQTEAATVPETQPEPDPYEAFYCSWVNLRGEDTMTLDAQGNAVYNGENGTYAFEDNQLHITLAETGVFLDITDHNGIPRLVSGWKYLDFVPETDAGEFAPVTVELTMDNWETYFELHEAPTFGYVDLIMPETGVPDFELWLKPEYVYKLLDAPAADDAMSKLNPVFTFRYDALGYTFKKNSSGEFVFEELEKLNSQQAAMVPEPRECHLLDYRPFNMTLNEENSPLFVNGGWYAAKIWTDNEGNPDNGTVVYPVNPAVASVSGTLTLLP